MINKNVATCVLNHNSNHVLSIPYEHLNQISVVASQVKADNIFCSNKKKIWLRNEDNLDHKKTRLRNEDNSNNKETWL